MIDNCQVKKVVFMQAGDQIIGKITVDSPFLLEIEPGGLTLMVISGGRTPRAMEREAQGE